MKSIMICVLILIQANITYVKVIFVSNSKVEK